MWMVYVCFPLQGENNIKQHIDAKEGWTWLAVISSHVPKITKGGLNTQDKESFGRMSGGVTFP